MNHPYLSIALSPKVLEFSSYQVTVLLIDDQPIVAEAVKGMLEDSPDITFHYCQDPNRAIEMISKIRPTVILQDLVMPEIDGLMLIRYLRANSSSQDVPLIVLSTREEPKIKESAFILGANDYLVKLPDKIELQARIRYHSNSYISLLQRNEAYSKLIASQQILLKELADAGSYVKSTLPPPLIGEIETWWKFIPSTQLSGDSFGYHWIDPDHFAIYLLDVCGHGVGAALLSTSITNTLKTQSLSNADFYNPSDVLKVLNTLYPMEKHNDMFSTIWYGIYNKQKRELTFSSAGHPPPILFQGDSFEKAEVQLLKTTGVPVGAIKDMIIQNDVVKIKKFNKLILFSDGLYEHKTPEGVILQYDNFVKHVSKNIKPSGSDLDTIIAYARLNEPNGMRDDMSIVEISFH